jgi:Helix-turn-helix domain
MEELEARFRVAETVVERMHFQVIWVLSKGRTVGETAEITAISERCVSKLAERYAHRGVEALGDRRRDNRGARPLLCLTILSLCASVCAVRRTTGGGPPED